MAAGLEPPRKLLCHGHWTVNDEKMSKTRGNVISPFTDVDDFTEDGLRYFLLRHAVLDTDTSKATNLIILYIRRKEERILFFLQCVEC